MGTSLLRVTFNLQNKAASELRKQAGDMFRCKKVKGERPSPLLFYLRP
jgi:hypothetical protein